MRIGNSTSRSYRRLKSHHRHLNNVKVARLCHRLDALVEKAESFGPKTKTRAKLMEMADKVRDKLRKVDH